MREITVEDVEDLALGAVVLGTGGGGDPHIGKLMLLQALERHGPVPLVRADELDPEGLLLPVAMAGAPTVMTERIPNGRELHQVLESLEARLGRRGVAIMPVEIGGINGLLPAAAAAELGLPLVDADMMRRAFPQIEMTLPHLAGIKASPFSLCDVNGNHVLLDAVDNMTAEKLVRACITRLGMAVMASAYPLTAKQCVESAANGSLSYCLEIGRLVRAVQNGEPGAYERFLDFCDAQILFTGKVIDIDRYTTDGWARGTVSLQHVDDPTRAMRVEIQNENLVAFEDGVPRVTVPDLITFLDMETGIPMTTEGLAYGQRLHMIAMPAEERWRTPQGVALAGPRAFGYDIDYVPFEVAR
ncbi:DUF917 domain-containing protein [Streptomyces sp. NPDC056716]|uniref:DUF917 domain-containing protein n=1 Tax=unclassified Streptomyces TaxID=2593676 RepID=UPI0036979C85